ncbi:MAG TPA: nitrile hydratase accessory protein [Acidimicrobiales bacterium]|nr:nitrile hydratase accessory protein [Acidimicrobiales bacterium]
MSDEPVFAAPWEARAFALAVRLRDSGHLPWTAFQERLATRIAADPAEATGYYEHWLASLEDVCTSLLSDRGKGPAG